MKRTGIPRLGAADEQLPLQQPPSTIQQQSGISNMHTLAQSAQPNILGAAAMLSVSGGASPFVRTSMGPRPVAPAVINYLKQPNAAVQYAAPKQAQQPVQMPRHKPLGNQSPVSVAPVQVTISSGGPPVGPPVGPVGIPGAPPPVGAQFQRLKVEDALSYLDQVKFKFNTQPQVYNDFLDIMKEFKSQSIDTPGVITRVSNLFKGHPELIVGFNTFLPPGYKIEVQSNGQVSVSMPSPTSLNAAGVGGVGAGGGVLLGVHHVPPPQPQLVHILPVPQSVSGAIVHNLSVSSGPQSNTLHHISQAHQQIEAAAAGQHHTPGGVPAPGGGGGHPPVAPAGQPVEFNHAIEYVNKIKSRFSRQPDKYKRFLEILHAYQRGHRDGTVKEPQVKQQTEQEVYSQVAKLFENQDDLLAEFGQFLPDASGGKTAAALPTTKSGHSHYATTPPQQTPPPAPVTHQPVSQRGSMEGELEGMGARYSLTPAPPASPPHVQHHPTHPQHSQITKHSGAITGSIVSGPVQHHHLKRSPSFTSSSQIGVGAPPVKKLRPSVLTGATVRDVTYTEAAKYGTLADFGFFDRVRKALRSQEVYDNFLRCLLLFTNEIISSSELLCVTLPFLCRYPELQKGLQDFVGPTSPPPTPTNSTHNSAPYNSVYGPIAASSNLVSSYERERTSSDAGRNERVMPALRYEPIGPLGAQLRHDRPQGDAAMDVDLSTCKRLGTSYCALPRGSAEAASRRCSGRTPLCKEVLNDTWVSFPTWSEDSTFVTSRKTQYEEYIYRCEDERFELDVVIETNAATIRVLEGVQKKMSRMTAEDAAKFRLDECLGGHSPTIHQRALRRIYGDKATDIIAGLKKNPMVAVPVVLRRLKAKEEEWREAQKGFNKQWREQNEKYYLKSLDHQGINFKQNDLKALRSKSLFNELDSACAAHRAGPHLTVSYSVRSRQEGIKIVRDAAELLIHHARRQTAIQKAEKRRIKRLLRQFLPDLFRHPRQPLSDDERDDEGEEPSSPGSPAQDENTSGNANVPIPPPNAPLKLEKQESSESDTNTSDRGGRNTRNNKDAIHKNNNTADTSLKENMNSGSSVGSKRSDSSNCDEPAKSELQDEDDIKDCPPSEARFVCTMSWYLFLRLHGVLCARLAEARRAATALAEQDARDQQTRHPSVALALRLKPSNVVQPSEYYNALLELVRGVLDGNTEAAAYEDAVREMLGIRAYPAYTLDKVVSSAVRQLQHCVSESWSLKAAEMAGRGNGGVSYVRQARRYLRAEHTVVLVRVHGDDDCRVTYELLESAGEGRTSPQNDNSRLSPTSQGRGSSSGATAARLAAWSLYTERYARGDSTGASPPRNKPVFLRRNARRCGGGSAVTRAPGLAERVEPAPRARRKPPRILDAAECTLAGRLRLLASRPHHMYRRGALSGARDSHARLHAQRRARFREWLLRRGPH